MAKLPAPKKAAVSARSGATGLAMEKVTPYSEAVGKFDKFGLFALLIPSVLLALSGLVLGIAYTHSRFDIGLLGILPGAKRSASWDAGEDAVKSLQPVEITGFECENYIARQQNGDVDVAVLSVGSNHKVNLGDVFTLEAAPESAKNVRIEFVVFEVLPSVSRAYILLGEDVSANPNAERAFSLSRDSIVKLCGGERDIKVKRQWRDQIVRRYVEPRAVKQ